MSGLDSIPVVVQGDLGADGHTENLEPLMLQLEQALQDLVDTGSTTVIDLSAMPFNDKDEEALRQRLGKGEVTARLDAFGPTSIEETGLSGVWLVEHKDAEGRRLTLQLEIGRVPSILVTPADDIADALAGLKSARQGDSGSGQGPENAP